MTWRRTARPARSTIRAEVGATARTGVEMEALTAASVAALTLYDMAKALQRDIVIERVELLEKEGGRSGTWSRDGERRRPSRGHARGGRRHLLDPVGRGGARRTPPARRSSRRCARPAGTSDPEAVVVPDDEDRPSPRRSSALAEAGIGSS